MFGHGDDLGEAAYMLEVTEPAKDEGTRDREEPRPKRARTTPGKVALVAASLEGVEARLQARGETARFALIQPGHLQHSCTTAEARVNFWPCTLRWSVEGRQGDVIEAALLAPMDEECLPVVSHAAAAS